MIKRIEIIALFALLLIVRNSYAERNEEHILKSRLDVLERELMELKSQCRSNIGSNQRDPKKRQQSTTSVAFSAVLDSHSQNTAAHNEPVKYDKVYTNIGLGYNNKTGVFHPPKDGLYQLYASAAVDGSDAVHAYIELNGVPLCGFTGGNWNTGSCMIIIPLHEGDSVWVRDVFGVHVRGTKVSSFTGLLL